MREERDKGALAKRVIAASLIINSLLAGLKVFAGLIAGSGALVADGIHSLSDFFIDIIMLIGVKFMRKPADSCHNHGHDKYETLISAGIGIALAAVGFKILIAGAESVIAYARGQALTSPGALSVYIAGCAVIIKEILFRITLKAGKKTDSKALTANAWHHRADAMASLGIFLGIGGAVLLGPGWAVLDPLASIIVSFFILKAAANILLPAISQLAERSVEPKELEAIQAIFRENQEVLDYHKLKTRRIGNRVAVEAHVLVNPDLNIERAHDITRDLEAAIKGEFGKDTAVTLHEEPYLIPMSIKDIGIRK